MKSAFRDRPTPPRHELHPQSPWGSIRADASGDRGGTPESKLPSLPQRRACRAGSPGPAAAQGRPGAPRPPETRVISGCSDLHPERLAPAGWQEASRCSHRGAGHPRSTPPRPRRAVKTSWTAAQQEAQRQERLRPLPPHGVDARGPLTRHSAKASGHRDCSRPVGAGGMPVILAPRFYFYCWQQNCNFYAFFHLSIKTQKHIK